MKFFVPQVKDPEQTEIVYAAIKKFVAELARGEILGRRIFAMQYTHEGKHFSLEVGVVDDQIRETVIAILQATDYFFVCTPSEASLGTHPSPSTQGMSTLSSNSSRSF